MEFTTAEMNMLVAALPGCDDSRRKELLPWVLREWGRTDLDEHLTRATREQIRAEQQQMKNVARRASELAQALADLGPDPSFAVARFLLASGDDAEEPTYEQALAAAEVLADESAGLQRLAKAALAVAAGWTLPGRHATVIRYLVLQDLAAIFEWATGKHAGRWIRTDTSNDPGKPHGPFWNFAHAAWPIIFGSSKGLGNSLKIWASARRRIRERSPFIANLDLRHPQWRVSKK
jgi:hypothetical protein